jgi:hypothetical protein
VSGENLTDFIRDKRAELGLGDREGFCLNKQISKEHYCCIICIYPMVNDYTTLYNTCPWYRVAVRRGTVGRQRQ